MWVLSLVRKEHPTSLLGEVTLGLWAVLLAPSALLGLYHPGKTLRLFPDSAGCPSFASLNSKGHLASLSKGPMDTHDPWAWKDPPPPFHQQGSGWNAPQDSSCPKAISSHPLPSPGAPAPSLSDILETVGVFKRRDRPSFTPTVNRARGGGGGSGCYGTRSSGGESTVLAAFASVPSGCNEATTDRGLSTTGVCVSQAWRLEVQDQGASRLGVSRGPSSSVACFVLLYPKGQGGVPGVSFSRALTPFAIREGSSLKTYSPPQGPAS